MGFWVMLFLFLVVVVIFLSVVLILQAFSFFFFFLNDPAPTEIYPLPLHDALPISGPVAARIRARPPAHRFRLGRVPRAAYAARTDPDVFRDAATRARAVRGGGPPLARDHRSGGAAAHPPRREPAALFPFGTAGHPPVAGARAARAPGAGSPRRVRAARGRARRHLAHPARGGRRRARGCRGVSPDAAEPARQRREVRSPGAGRDRRPRGGRAARADLGRRRGPRHPPGRPRARLGPLLAPRARTRLGRGWDGHRARGGARAGRPAWRARLGRGPAAARRGQRREWRPVRHRVAARAAR